VSVIYAWLSRHPKLVDGVLALVLAVLSVGPAFGPGRPGLAIPITLLLVVPVVFRRKSPVAAFAVAATGGAWEIVANIGPRPADLAVVVLLYTVAAYRPRRVSVLALAVCLPGSAVAVAVWTPAGAGIPQQLFEGSVLFGGTALVAWVLGDSMRYRRAYLSFLEDRAATLEAERDAQAQVAAAAERARIARELHDVIAHNVSVMVVQADGASYALETAPDRARQALTAISATGRQALTEMRRLLGILRAGDERAELAPLPGLDQLRELVEQARAAGMSVSLTRQGTARPLDEGAELAAYRVVQESLTNARKHGGLAVAAAVRLEYSSDSLLVQVSDDGRGAAAAEPEAPAGHGLTGMRERITMYGGTLQAGPRPGGGFQVTARVPLGRLAAADRAVSAGPALDGPELTGPELTGPELTGPELDGPELAGRPPRAGAA
jgi:signal transduction histidine kinase